MLFKSSPGTSRAVYAMHAERARHASQMATSIAARATRAVGDVARFLYSHFASSSDDGSRCLLLALSHDELGVIFDGLADPLQPTVAVALSSTCLGLRTPLRAALEVLKERRNKAKQLCLKVGQHHPHWRAVFADLRAAKPLRWASKGLTADDMTTLGMLLPWLPNLQGLVLYNNCLGDPAVQALCEGMRRVGAVALVELNLGSNQLGPTSCEALATTLLTGALQLKTLVLSLNPIGNQGLTNLARPFRRACALKHLHLIGCEIGDEGMASLLSNLGKDDFKALEKLDLDQNKLTGVGWAAVASALGKGAMPKLNDLFYLEHGIGDEAREQLARVANTRGIHLGNPAIADNSSDEDVDEAADEDANEL